jgi:dihydrofolate reductase
MRNIIAVVWMSLDGVVESPEQWAFAYANEELQEVNEQGMAASDALLLGRVTYQEFAAYWPTQPDDVPMAAYLNRVPKIVVSTTLAAVTWHNATLLHGNVVEGLTALKRQPGKTITTIGSATLVRSLLHHDLLDTLRLLVPPLVRGTGTRLFPHGSVPQALTLVDAQTFRTGVVSLTYQPARHAP